MWVTLTPFPAVQPVSCAFLPCPPTSAPQKQYPAFSTQMEVTPYASEPLSFCRGSWGPAALVEVTMKESSSLCAHFFSLAYSIFTLPPRFLSDLNLYMSCCLCASPRAPSCSVFSSVVTQCVPACICSRCFGSITF